MKYILKLFKYIMAGSIVLLSLSAFNYVTLFLYINGVLNYSTVTIIVFLMGLFFMEVGNGIIKFIDISVGEDYDI